MKNKFEQIIALGARMNPVQSVDVINLGVRRKVKLSCGGGMGGASWVWVGLLKPDMSTKKFQDARPFVELELTEAKEIHVIGKRWIVDITPVYLWKYVEQHDNTNYKDYSPWVQYFTAPLHIGFEAKRVNSQHDIHQDLDKTIERYGDHISKGGC